MYIYDKKTPKINKKNENQGFYLKSNYNDAKIFGITNTFLFKINKYLTNVPMQRSYLQGVFEGKKNFARTLMNEIFVSTVHLSHCLCFGIFYLSTLNQKNFKSFFLQEHKQKLLITP